MKQQLTAIILAGGGSQRFARGDKARAILAGRRLIDYAVDRVRAQAGVQFGEIFIAGADDYGTGLPLIPDAPEGPQGPTAALYAAAQALPAEAAIFSVPVDSPFLPADVAARLIAAGPVAVASVNGRLCPTVGLWSCRALRATFAPMTWPPSPSLHAVAEACGAQPCAFADEAAFLNVNTAAQLDAAEAALRARAMAR